MDAQQLVPSSTQRFTSLLRRTLRKSRVLRKIHNNLRNKIISDEALLRKRHIPEDAFSRIIRDNVTGIMEKYGKPNIGEYLEFGVFNGTSLSCAYRVFHELGLRHVRFFGFDSFEGLPSEADSEDEGLWLPGQLACRLDVTERLLTERGVDRGRVFLIKGWFKDTLTPELIERYQLRKASVIMVDCDIYSSTVTCLDFIEPLIVDEAILIFDDWSSFNMAQRDLGEARAFREFLKRHPEFEAAELGSYNDNSLVFSIVRKA